MKWVFGRMESYKQDWDLITEDADALGRGHIHAYIDGRHHTYGKVRMWRSAAITDGDAHYEDLPIPPELEDDLEAKKRYIETIVQLDGNTGP